MKLLAEPILFGTLKLPMMPHGLLTLIPQLPSVDSKMCVVSSNVCINSENQCVLEIYVHETFSMNTDSLETKGH